MSVVSGELRRIAAGAARGMGGGSVKSRWMLVTDDTIAEIEAPGYFNAQADQLVVGDQIDVSANLSAEPEMRSYVVAAKAGTAITVRRAGSKLSSLPTAGAIAASDLFGVDQGAGETKATAQQVADFTIAGRYRISNSWRQYRFSGTSAGSAPAIVIGGGDVTQSEDGVGLSSDGAHCWMKMQATRNEAPVELVIYPSAAQGNARATSGTNQITRLEGTPFSAAWIGKRFWFGERIFRVATVPSADLLTVVEDFTNAAVTFSSTYDETYHHFTVRGVGTCNVSGATVTRIVGDPFIPFLLYPFRLWVNGVERTAIACPDINTYTLSGPIGTLTNVPYSFEIDIDSNISAIRIQKVLGGNEENFSLLTRFDGYYIRSQVAGTWGRYRPIIISSGALGPGALRRQVNVYPSGDITLGGQYDTDTLRLLAPNGAATNRFEIGDGTLGFAVTLRARGADTNVGMAFDTKGTGGWQFTSGSFGGRDFAIYGIGNSTSWLAASGSTGGLPSLAAAGAAATIDIGLFPKGAAGRLRFGTFTSNADAPINGFVEIRDAAGNIRKLATIA